MIFVVCVLGITFVSLLLLSLRYRNKYKCTMVIGKPGSGKSTLLCKLALKYSKRGWKVFSTEHTPGTYYISPDWIGFFQIPPDSVLLIDEIGMLYDNRKFKTFPEPVRDFFKLHRHYKVKIFMFSQSFDVDKKIRDITDDMYILSIAFRMFSYGKRVLRKLVLTKSVADRPSTIQEDLRFDSLLWFWCGSRTFTFIPKYAKYFDSYACPDLEQKEYEFIPLKKRIEKDEEKVEDEDEE